MHFPSADMESSHGKDLRRFLFGIDFYGILVQVRGIEAAAGRSEGCCFDECGERAVDGAGGNAPFLNGAERDYSMTGGIPPEEGSPVFQAFFLPSVREILPGCAG